MDDAPVYLVVAAFGELHGAENALKELQAAKRAAGIKVAVVMQIVINLAAGKNEPILNTLNAVFTPYGIDWEVSVTHKFGDATEFARQAAERGFDLVVGYGGDGTQHEIANGVIGTGVPMGVLPGGTGNGFANELGIPSRLQPAVELLCTSHNQRQIDVAQIGEAYFIQRLFTGIEPEEQTSREMKDKYGNDSLPDARHQAPGRDTGYPLSLADRRRGGLHSGQQVLRSQFGQSRHRPVHQRQLPWMMAIWMCLC